MKTLKPLFFLTLLALGLASCEVEEIRMPDYEVGIVASADIAEGRYWFNATDLPNTTIAFNLNYDGFGVHEASEITLFVAKGGQQVAFGTFNSFPATISLSAEEAYALFGETLADYDDDGSGKDEFVFTYEITTTEGLAFSEFGQYYSYNPSQDGRFTGKFGQFSTNLPGFGQLIFDVRPPNPTHPNEI